MNLWSTACSWRSYLAWKYSNYGVSTSNFQCDEEFWIHFKMVLPAKTD
jgi:hypothetical protein